MNLFNLFICRITFEDEPVILKTVNFFLLMFKFIPNEDKLVIKKSGDIRDGDRLAHMTAVELDELDSPNLAKPKITDRERRRNARYFWTIMVVILVIHALII